MEGNFLIIRSHQPRPLIAITAKLLAHLSHPQIVIADIHSDAGTSLEQLMREVNAKAAVSAADSTSPRKSQSLAPVEILQAWNKPLYEPVKPPASKPFYLPCLKRKHRK